MTLPGGELLGGNISGAGQSHQFGQTADRLPLRQDGPGPGQAERGHQCAAD